jgi:hypothetical protein
MLSVRAHRKRGPPICCLSKVVETKVKGIQRLRRKEAAVIPREGGSASKGPRQGDPVGNLYRLLYGSKLF